MTVDEELSKLEEDLRRLKIEYETYFNGGSQRPPNDTIFRVERVLKKYAGPAADLTLRQRFKLNQLAQSFTVNNELWRKKLKVKEEGGPVRARELGAREGAFTTAWSDPDAESEKVQELLRAVGQARMIAGEPTEGLDPARFAQFIRDKTAQCKRSLGCERVRFSVSVEGGRVKLRATKEE
ncbi:MAG: hypothetical protein KGM47_05900 [Acidobacteriota bacterium]|nr:hypothetical protein [Acidobacteriota bacterium]